jgi:UDP-glucuronate decarboxylase
VQALQNQDISVFGEGQQTRSFCYVDDMITGLVSMMETDPKTIGPVNLGNPQELSIRGLADIIIRLTGSRSKVVHRPLPQDDPKQRRPDISEAQRVLGWEPRVPLEQGLQATIEYFERLLSDGVIQRQTNAVVF